MAKQITKDELDEKEVDEQDEDEDEDEAEDSAPVRSKGDGLDDKVLVATPMGVMTRGVAVGIGANNVGSFIRNTWTICRREVRSYFDSLVAYVVIGLSMLGVGLYFFLLDNGFWQTDRASMNNMFDTGRLSLPWMICGLVVPILTMRALSEEKRSGTIELLITLPVRDTEVVLGKYFAALFMVIVLFAASLIYPIAMFKWPWHLGPLDWGTVWSAYIGLFLMAAAGVAVGLLYSSITESQIIAFFLTAFTLLVLMAIGYMVETFPGWIGDSIAFVSFQSRFAPFSRGVVDTRAIVYFLSIAVVCLLLAFRSLESRKWS